MPSKVVIIGSSGYVGSATITSLASDAFKSKVDVKAGVRDPAAEKAQSLKAGDNVELIKADMGDEETMLSAFKDADAVFVVTPGHIDREQLTINAVKAAKKANAKFVAVVSVPTSGTDSIFGRQLAGVETYVKKAGIPYTILRLPFFTDNFFGNQDPIKSQGKIYAPARPDAAFTPIAVQDVGLVAATILADPSKHHNKTYTLTAPTTTHAQAAEAFGRVLGKKVEYVQVPYSAAKETFLGFGMPEWQVDGVMELFRYFDADSKLTNQPNSDVKDVTGQEPLSVEAWATAMKGAFQ